MRRHLKRDKMKTETISAKEFINEQVKIAKKRGSKYRNVKTVVDGITFDSKKEAQRYAELRMMELAGEIKDLKCKSQYPFIVEGGKICSYIADFEYLKFFQANTPIGGNGICVSHGLSRVVEDVKSEITRKNPAYRIKKKLMKAIYGIDILET